MENQTARLSDLVDGLSEKSVLILFFLISPVAVVAPKGIVLLVAFAGITGLISWLNKGRPGISLPRLPMVLLALTLLWALASSLWALDTAGAETLTVRLMALCVCGVALLHSMQQFTSETGQRLEKFFLAGYGAGALALSIGYLFALITGRSLWSTFADDPLTTLNNGAAVMALLYFPFATILWKRRHRAGAIAAGVLLLVALFLLSSDAAILSLIVGVMVASLVIFLGRPGVLVIAAVVCAVFITAPTLSKTFLPPPPLQGLNATSPSSADHRRMIWQFVNGRIDQKPLWGWGMDSSRNIPKEEFRISPILEILPLHPHNAALQVRLELGLPGAILVSTFIAAMFWTLSPPGIPVPQRAVGAAVICSYLTIAFISYGVWQNWWVAVAWAVAGITCLIANPKDTGQPLT